MSFESRETSRAKGTPADLYLFRYGVQPASYYAYTNAVREIVHHDPVYAQDVTYEPLAIMRDGIKSSGSLDKAQLRITAPRDIALRTLFEVYPPSSVVTLVIRQGHMDDPDNEFLVAWAGRVLSFEREGSSAVMGAEPISTALRRSGLRRHYQITCPHYLYGDDCKADRVAATVSATVDSLSGHDVTLVGGWNPHPIAKYRGGEFRWTLASGEVAIRQVLRSVGSNTLTLSGPPTGLAVAQAVDVALGCNHQTGPVGGSGDCTTLHDNGPNFGGCKWIPKKNPIGFVDHFG